MKKLLLLFLFALPLSAQAPTKLFDVKNGNGIVDNGVAQAQATYVVYRDANAKTAIIQAFCDAYGYQATINGQPNPQSKQAFFNQQITHYIKDVYRAQLVKTAAEAAGKTAGDNADADLPPTIKQQ